MKKRLLIAILLASSCIMDEPVVNCALIEEEQTETVEYWHKGEIWICETGYVFIDGNERQIYWPISLRDVINVGTLVEWQCSRVTKYRSCSKWMPVDWDKD